MKNIIKEDCLHYEKYMGISHETTKKIFYYVQWAGFFKCKESFYIERQGFKSILLLQTVKGKGILHYKGEKKILEPQKFVLIDCMEPHTYFPLENENWEFRFIHFSGNRSFEIYRYLCMLAGGFEFELTPTIVKNIDYCIEKCEGGAETEIKISKALMDIIYDCIIDLGDNSFVDDVLQYIANNYSNDITTETLAKEFGMSRCHFLTKFKKTTGKTVHDCLLGERVFQAKKILAFSEKSISEISEGVGFTDVGTFIRNFKKIEKITPLQYRKQHIN